MKRFSFMRRNSALGNSSLNDIFTVGSGSILSLDSVTANDTGQIVNASGGSVTARLSNCRPF